MATTRPEVLPRTVKYGRCEEEDEAAVGDVNKASSDSCRSDRGAVGILGVSSLPLPLPLPLLLRLSSLEACEDDRFCSCCLYASATAPAGVSGEPELGLPRLESVESMVRCGDGVGFDVGLAAAVTDDGGVGADGGGEDGKDADRGPLGRRLSAVRGLVPAAEVGGLRMGCC